MKIIVDEMPSKPEDCLFADILNSSSTLYKWCRMTGDECEHTGEKCPFLKAEESCEKHSS